jgi:hypothetical protein
MSVVFYSTMSRMLNQLTLHEESEHDVSSSVELVVSLRVDANSLGFERGGRGHRIFSSDTDTVDELSPAAGQLWPSAPNSIARLTRSR